MCVNGDESEPATFNNREPDRARPAPVPRGDPDRLLRHPGVSTAYVYLRGEYILGLPVMEQAIAEAERRGHLGKNIYGSGFDLDVYCTGGPGPTSAARRRG